MRFAVVTQAQGTRYQPLLARMLTEFHRVHNGIPVVSFTDVLPEGAPRGLELPYAAYCAKPFAMLAASHQGYDVLLWLDASCYPIKNITLLIDAIEDKGYYTQDNGWRVGEWCSDDALETLDITREQAWEIPEISTMAFGLDLRQDAGRTFLQDWARLAADGVTFVSPHANSEALDTVKERGLPVRTIGFVSHDKRVMGHRHDQTAASVLAWRNGWEMIARPTYVDYFTETPNERTVILNRGGL